MKESDVNCMKEKILNTVLGLFKVKTIITLVITVVFVVLVCTDKLPIETTTMVIGMVFTYYFSKVEEK